CVMKKLVLLMALVVAASNAFSAFRSNGQLPFNVSSVAETDSLLVVDSLALVALFDQCNGPEWQNSANWLDGPLDTWYGVTVENNRVTILQLEGEWHTKFGLENTLPSQMGNLTDLKVLNLGYNNLTDAFPEVTGSMKNLEDLNLAGNNLQGPLPDTL